MAILSDYTAGTASVAAGGTAVTGSGTAWLTAGFREGDLFIANGWSAVIQSVESNTSLTLYPNGGVRGAALSGAPYRIRYMSDGSRVSAQTRQLIDLLSGTGSLEALAGLSGIPGGIPVFTGPGAMELLTRQDLTQGVRFDVQVNTLPDRALYNGAAEGFAVLVSDIGDGRSAVYSRVGAAGNWTAPAYLTGPKGNSNLVGTSSSSVSISTGNKTFTIVEGDRSWSVGTRLRAARTSTPASFIEGYVTSYSGNTLVLAVTNFSGTGTHSDWTINVVGEPGSLASVTGFWNTRLTSDSNALAAANGIQAVSYGGSQSLTATHKAQVADNTGLGLMAGLRNKIINPLFQMNQRSKSGTVVLSAGQYGHDRFKAGSSGCTYTFSTSAGVTTITITAGSLQQVIESTFLESGTYYLSWEGTAQGRIGTAAYGASPRTSSALTGGANITVEWNTGTLRKPQFTKGFVSEFSARDPVHERLLCQYYYQLNAGGEAAWWYSSVTCTAAISSLTPMRISSPSCSVVPGGFVLEPGVAGRVASTVSAALSEGRVDLNTEAATTPLRMGVVAAYSVAFDAEL